MPVHIEQLESHWMDFCEMSSVGFFFSLIFCYSSVLVKIWTNITGTLREN